MAILALSAAPLPVYGDQKSKAALIDEMLAVSNAREGYNRVVGTIVELFRVTAKTQRRRIEAQLQPTHPADDRPSAKKELDAALDEFEASINRMMQKGLEWDSIKSRVAAAYDDLFSEEELAGIVAFYKTPIGQAYARKMPDFAARTGQLSKDAAQAMQPEVMRLVLQTMQKAAGLGYTWTPPPAQAAAPPPGAPAGAMVGSIIGSLPSPDAPQTQRLLVGANVQQAKLIEQPKPAYPPLAKQARISGHVLLNAVIGKDGAVRNLVVASGHPLLVPAAMEAVKQWVYQPTIFNGEPVEVMTQIDVNFALNRDEPPLAEGPGAASDSMVKLAGRGDIAGLRARLSSGASPNEPDDSVVPGFTPLMAAAATGNVDAVRLLLNAGAAIDTKTQQGSTALDIAVRGGKDEVADLLRARAEPRQ